MDNGSELSGVKFEAVGVGGGDGAVMVEDRSLALANCPSSLGCVSQCFDFVLASLIYSVGAPHRHVAQGFSTFRFKLVCQ